MRALVLAVLVLGTVASACGSSDSDEAAAPATETATPPTTAPAKTTEADPVDALDSYLDAVGDEQGQYLEVRQKARGALDSVDTSGGPDQSWRTAANELKEARDRYNELAVRMKGIEPPPELADAHDELAKSLQLFAQFVDQLQADLRDENLQAVLGWEQTLTPLGQRTNELRADWRIETLAYAREIGADVPAWVEKVGTRD